MHQAQTDNDWLNVLIQGSQVRTQQDFLDFMNQSVKRILPFGMLACGVAYINDDGTFNTYRVVTINYPAGYLKHNINAEGRLESPFINDWVATNDPQIFSPSEDVWPSFAIPDRWLENFKAYEFENLVAHGQRDILGKATSYFSFHRFAEGDLAAHLATLRRILPILHSALFQVVDVLEPLGIEPTVEAQALLSEREMGILREVAAGHSNKVIAGTLEISEHTVRNHLLNMFKKLGVNNRGQALMKAEQLHLFNKG